MLDQEIISSLQMGLKSILYSPMSINQNNYIDIYNKVYSFCTRTSSTYEIQGAEVYNVLAQSLESFFSNSEFSASIPNLYQQILLFNLSFEIISNVFRYLERFYIKTSILNGNSVKKLSDLFFYKVYYSYLYKIEENLLNLIFFEIETLRKNHIQELTQIKTIVEFYIKALATNEQSISLNSFYKRYINSFKKSFNSNIEIGKMLKKLYLEVFFATNLFSDKEISKEIILAAISRKDEILDYAFLKIKNFAKIKHIFKIVNQMPDGVRARMKDRYTEFVYEQISIADDFQSYYEMFNKLTEQIKVNKMTNYEEILEEQVKLTFREKSSRSQSRIIDGLVDLINLQVIDTNNALSQLRTVPRIDVLEQSNIDTVKSENQIKRDFDISSNHVIKALKFEHSGSNDNSKTSSENFYVYQADETHSKETKILKRLSSDLNKIENSKDSISNQFSSSNTALLNREFDNRINSESQELQVSNSSVDYELSYRKQDIISILNAKTERSLALFCLLSDEYSADKLMESLQSRLLCGYNPLVEAVLSEILIERLGLGLMSKIKNSVNSFINREIFLFESNSLQSEIDVNMVKLTKGFWAIDPDKIELYPDLALIVTRCVEYIKLQERERLEFNFSLSPLTVSINNTIYKMAADTFSVYLHILNSNDLNTSKLMDLAKDIRLEHHITTLMDSGLIIFTRKDNELYLTVTNIQKEEKYIDLFTISKKQEILKTESSDKFDQSFIFEARLCKHMKRVKIQSRESLISQFSSIEVSMGSIIDVLISKGYLEEKDGTISYVP